MERVQNAADAAAMAGVTFLPIDLANAQPTAKTVAGAQRVHRRRQRHRHGGASATEPTQLQVTISADVDNAFAGAFSNGLTTITRSATADYNGPAPMGSPCNTFGNEPLGTTNAGPVGSQLTIPPVARPAPRPRSSGAASTDRASTRSTATRS